MRPGARVAGRWVVEAELPSTEELRRFRVRDGEMVAEAVAPTAHALLRPGTREGFLRPVPSADALLPTLATDVVDGIPVRVHPVRLGTFEGARISAAEALAAAGWLAPAVVAAGGASNGELGPEDLVVDRDGVVRFAPSGVPRAVSVARAPHTRAPDGGTDAAADLYGLGATLYQALTGSWPTRPTPGTPGAPVSPPSDYGLGAEADAVLLGLLSEDPHARLAAVEGLPAAPFGLAERTLAPPVRAPAAAPTSPIRTTVTAPAPVLPAGRPAPWAVLVPLAGLTPAQLRVLASRAASNPEAVRRAAERGGTWCVDIAATEAEANRVLSRLTSAGVPGGRVVSTTAPRVVQYLALALVSAVAAFVTGVWPVFGGIAAILVYMAAVNLRGMYTVANDRMFVQERERYALPDTALEGRLRALRRRVAAAELPEVVLADLRGEVATIEGRVDTLREHEAELAGTENSELAARRARVEAELAGVEAEVSRLDAALTRALTEDLADEPPRLTSTEGETEAPRPQRQTQKEP